MTDTKFVSNEVVKSRAAVIDKPIMGVAAVTEVVDAPGRTAHPGWLPIPATTEAIGAAHGEKAQRRVLCESVLRELRAGDRLEQRVWIVLSMCSGVAILYAAYCFFFRG